MPGTRPLAALVITLQQLRLYEINVGLSSTSFFHRDDVNKLFVHRYSPNTFKKSFRIAQSNLFLRQQCTKQWLYCEYIYCDVRDGGEGIITSVKLENLPSHVLAEVTVELYPPYDLIRFENSNLIQSAVSECVK